MNKHILSKFVDEINYPFPNFNAYNFVWVGEITYQFWDQFLLLLVISFVFAILRNP